MNKAFADYTMHFLNKIIEAATPDLTIQITRAVAEEIQCPEWISKFNTCDTPDDCFCRNAAERVWTIRASALPAEPATHSSR